MKEKLISLLKNAHAPYSNVYVSAIVKTDKGEFSGVNIENSSFGATNCAERSAIFAAVSAGVKKHGFKELHLISNQSNFLYPCSICRQVMTEFFDEKTKIFIHSKDSDECKIESLESLVPNPVSSESFKWK